MPSFAIQQAFQSALQHHANGRLAEAETIYREILTAHPNHPDPLHLLGVVMHQRGRSDLAVELIGKSIAIAPNNPATYSNLAEAYRGLGEWDEAVRHCRQALELQPDFADAYNNLGNALRHRGDIDEALLAYQKALQLRPDSAPTYGNLGNALRDKGRLDDAETAYRRGLELQPNDAEAFINLGDTLKAQGRMSEAIAAFRNAFRLDPAHPGAICNVLYTSHFVPGDGLSQAEECSLWARHAAELGKPLLVRHANEPDPVRRLRVGYVSPDFCEHVVGQNVLPLFRNHDRERFEIYCYSGVGKADGLTETFRRLAGHWRSAVGLSDDALAAMIRKDRIDILVDLTQHMAGNRLHVFARQPAPVQVSFAGYPGATGVDEIGHRISDRYLESGNVSKKAGQGGGWIDRESERVHLLDSFWCYEPRGIELPVNALPAKEHGFVTFGSLNNFCKINEPVLKLWAQLLHSVPHSRLAMLAPEGGHRQRTVQFFECETVDASRIEFFTPCPRREYFELYHGVDIMLDPFPYNGHTTSLDALWMGVPVVSLCGERPVSRGGLSQLTNLGLPELIAHTEDDYVRIAAALARDLPRLGELRATLRPRLENSILMDAPRLARQIEAAYRAMWKDWCEAETVGR